MKFWRMVLVLAILAVFMMPPAAYAEQVSGPSVDISIAKYDPAPVEPSRYVDVWLNVENRGDQDSGDVIVDFLGNFPFYVESGANSTANVGRIPASSAIVKKFRFIVDPKAPQGTSYLKLRYTSTGNVKIEKSLGLEVRTREALLSVISAKTEPGEVQAGSRAKLTISIENLAVKTFQDVVVRLDFSAGTFSPIDSSSERRIYQLLPGETEELSYEIIADPSASSGVYRLPFSLTYADPSGTNYSKSGIVGIILNSPPSLELNIETKDALRSDTANSVIFSVSNTGPSKIKFLTISVLPKNTYTVIGRTKEYLGKLDPDDFETAEFKVYFPENVNASDFEILLEYRDAFNKELSEKRTVSAPVYSAADLVRLGIGQQSGYGSTLFALFVLAVIYYLWRRRKRKRA